jgi:hypothetical protein
MGERRCFCALYRLCATTQAALAYEAVRRPRASQQQIQSREAGEVHLLLRCAAAKTVSDAVATRTDL